MPRDGSGIYSKPFPNVVEGTTIESAVHNGTVTDVEIDLNAARPVIAGGTGATSAAGARDNLDAERSMQTVTNFDSHVWEAGSFFSAAANATAPTMNAFTGIVYGPDANNMVVEARDLVTGLVYIRKRVGGGAWSAWAVDGEDRYVNVAGDTMTGDLRLNYADPTLRFNCGGTASNFALLSFTRSNVPRWSIAGITPESETGGNTGSNFRLASMDDAGLPIRQNLTINRATGLFAIQGNMTAGAGTFSGQLTGTTATFSGDLSAGGGTFSSGLTTSSITVSWASGQSVITINKTGAAGSAAFEGRTTNVARWHLLMPDQGSETDNTGGNFVIKRFHGPAATYMGAPLTIQRDTGDLRIGEPASATPGFGNTNAGTVFKQNGAAYHSAAGVTPLFINVNADGYVQSFQRSGTQVGAIQVNSTSSSFVSSSDARLKEDLQSFDAGHIIDDTNVYDFKWKSTGERAYGMLAQEAKDVYPAATFYNADTDRWFMDTSKYVPVILQELQALRRRVAELEVLAGVRPAPPDPKRKQ